MIDPCRLPALAPADYRVSVILPVYSENKTVRQITDWLRSNLGDMLVEIIVVVSPRSQLESRRICEELACEDARIRVYTQRQNPGLGHAVREGLSHSTGNLVLLMDSDGEMEIETIPRMFAEMAVAHHGMVIASRWARGGGFRGYSRLKYGLNFMFQQIFRLAYWTQMTDLTYGYKLLRGDLARAILWEGTLHEIACETTLKPIRLGVSVAQVPTWWTARTSGVSKNSFWKNFRYFATALRILVCGVVLQPVAKAALVPAGK